MMTFVDLFRTSGRQSTNSLIEMPIMAQSITKAVQLIFVKLDPSMS